jgi:predicted kinase
MGTMSDLSQKLIILCGIPFSGKSSFANFLIQKSGYIRIDLDEIKFDLFGKSITDEQIDQRGWDDIYHRMYQEIENHLQKGQIVVHDTGNFTIYERGLVNQIAQRLGIPFITIFVNTSVEEAKQRLMSNQVSKTRFDVSDKSFHNAVDEMEKPIDSENPLILNAIDSYEDWVKRNL